jgi:hypothetical protein
MDFFKNISDWINGVLIASLLGNAISIINLIRSTKMLPKDLKGADLDNRTKEISMVEIYDEIATRAAGKVMEFQKMFYSLQDRFVILENDNKLLKDEQRLLKDEQKLLKLKVESQDVIISEQTKTIETQNAQIDKLNIEIDVLVCELNNNKLYNSTLIEQMKKENIIPIDIDTLPIEDCEKILERVV